jgi:hypothetical protein
MMVRAPGRVEGCAKIAMTVLRSICMTMGLLRQPKWPKLIFTERRAVRILLIMKWARGTRCNDACDRASKLGRSTLVHVEKRHRRASRGSSPRRRDRSGAGGRQTRGSDLDDQRKPLTDSG